jgi:hypothetical protein
MHNIFLYYLLLTTLTLLVAISAKYVSVFKEKKGVHLSKLRSLRHYLSWVNCISILGLAQFALNEKPSSQDYNGPWGEGVKCPYENPRK